MKLKSFLMTCIAAVLFLAACDDEKKPSVADVAGNYSGYTLASCAYFKNNCTENETVSVAENPDGTAKVTLASQSWGTLVVANALLTVSGDQYILSGSGEAQMGMGGNVSAYECSFTCKITSPESAEMRFTVPGVMGGLTIDFITGAAPAEYIAQ